MGRLGIAASLGQAAWATHRQWRQLPPDHRHRLQLLLRQSGGRPLRLSPMQRQELLGLVAELNLGQVLRASAARASRHGVRRRS
jgi:hypothetical protein